MDFALEPEQQQLVELAGDVFARHATTTRVAATEQTDDRVDRNLWRVLADTGLLGLAIDERWGGGGCGPLELALLLEQQGRRVAPVPLWATLALGAAPISRYGSERQRARWLPAVADGTAFLTGGFEGVDPQRGVSPAAATTLPDGGLVLSGSLLAVPAAHLAARVLVAAHVGADASWRLALLDPETPGVTRTRAVTTDRQVHEHLELAQVTVPAEDVITLGADDVAQVVDLARAMLCAVQVGVLEEAVALTGTHLRQRRQFGREIGSFQAVSMRAADTYIDLEAMRLTMLQAVWLLSRGYEAGAEVAAACWWAAEAGHRGLHAALHLHGGLGNDVEYPLHRYFLWSRQLGLMLGGAAASLARLAELVPTLR